MSSTARGKGVGLAESAELLEAHLVGVDGGGDGALRDEAEAELQEGSLAAVRLALEVEEGEALVEARDVAAGEQAGVLVDKRGPEEI
jgi:hypothetical protein